MNETLKNFINENLDLINQDTKESWEAIYKKLIPLNITGQFTEVMLSAGIEPTDVMTDLPKWYLCNSNIKHYEVPSNVTKINSFAFLRCANLKSILINTSITSIDNYAFYSCSSLKEIQYKGTKKQAMQLGIGNRSKKRWREASSIEKIICTDGVIEL